MKMTFRWYGKDDPVKLRYIRQVPAVKGIVSALYDVPVGEAWPKEGIASLKKEIEDNGLEFTVIESIPVHEDIKLGRSTRDGYIENYMQSIQNMGELGIPYLCYNFMPVFDWTRSDLEMRHDDGSTSLSYDHEQLKKVDLRKDDFSLPGWATSYSKDELNSLLDAYAEVDSEKLWENLAYFLKAVIPVAEQSGVKMAIHPDDPPWPIFGLPRIITDKKALDRLTDIVNSSSNGITFCTGSLGPNGDMNIVETIKEFSGKGRVHFVHTRNIKRTGQGSFYESRHPTEFGDVDMYGVVKALVDTGFTGAIRPDHGRMIWGETGRPGYGLYDRSLGAMYVYGLWEACEKCNSVK
jgi:mannonate dehydratase